MWEHSGLVSQNTEPPYVAGEAQSVLLYIILLYASGSNTPPLRAVKKY